MATHCVVCHNPLAVRWCDQHGIGACVTCGMPYTIYHYEGEGDARHRVDKAPEPALNDTGVAMARRYWTETQMRVFPGIYDMGLGRSGATYSGATREDIKAFNAWSDKNRAEFDPAATA